jgi:hypothetical protein
MTARPGSGHGHCDASAVKPDEKKRDAQLPDPQLPDPKAVLGDSDLSEEEKIEKLRRWSYDARELEVANEEGMGGTPRPSNLDDVQKALRRLGAKDIGTTHKQ